ncbi:hypothetical protein EV360DRAFT_85412 [Lentinula raphanica]|nr:hypothetical protein EV360DRAFT_85412 [Lentinula raphanica]
MAASMNTTFGMLFDAVVVGAATLIIEIFFSDAIALAVQMFYCWRLWRLSQGNYFVVIPLIVFSLGAFREASLGFLPCSALMMPNFCSKPTRCLSLQFSTFEELTSLKNLSMTCNILAAVSDILISSAMVLFLQKAKNSHKSTNSMLNRLIIFTFNTGLPVSFCALWACISINAWPTTFIYMFFFLLQGRLYTNSLLVSLNSRNYIKKGKNVLTETAPSYVMRPYPDSRGDVVPGSRGSKVSRDVQDDGGIAIRINTTTHTDIEFADDSASSKADV